MTQAHTEFLKKMRPERRAYLTMKSDEEGIRRLLGHVGLIVVFALYILIGGPLWWVMMLPLGICLVFMFTLLHETVHDTPFESPYLNRWVGRVAGFVVFLPPLWFRYFHLAHHKYTQIEGKDPELITPKPQSFREYLVYLSAVPYWRSEITNLVNIANEKEYDFVPKAAKARTVTEARMYLLGYLAVMGLLVLGNSWIIWVWLLPSVLGQPFMRVYLLAEHGLCPFVANMFENTRTTFTNSVVRYIAWNMPYHAEHHTYPNVPFFRLPEFHIDVSQNLQATSEGYIDFHKEYQGQLKTS